MHPALVPSTAEGLRPRTAAEPAALVVCHEVRPESQAAYEAWLQAVRRQCRQFDRHLGAEIIRPSPGTAVYTIVVRFESMEHLGVCLNSLERRAQSRPSSRTLPRPTRCRYDLALIFGSHPRSAP